MTMSTTLLLGLVGPPAAGKHTVGAALTSSAGIQVIRLEEFVEERRRHRELNAESPVQASAHGDAAVGALLRAAFVRRTFPVTSTIVVLRDLPGSPAQMGLMQSVGRACGVRVGVVELDAPDLHLADRAHHRRVCPACRPDIAGVSRSPTSSEGTPTICPTCGGPLAVLGADEPHAFLTRLHQYRQRRAEICSTAGELGVPWARIESTPDVKSCVDRVRAALILMTGAPSLIAPSPPPPAAARTAPRGRRGENRDPPERP